MFDSLKAAGFQVECVSHAEAILSGDFPSAALDLEQVLLEATIPIEEIIASGGGESRGTQRLRHALSDLGWKKGVFKVQRVINDVPKESQSHEIDHVKQFKNGYTLVLEIEWNNKDPFYDRDLENFKRLHADGAISVGIIVTRGQSMHDNMKAMVRRFLDERDINGFDDMIEWGYVPTPKQKAAIVKAIARAKNPLPFRDAFTRKFVSDKYGEATTHWRKLDDRIRRGVGNPCPLVFIGLPDGIVTFHEGKKALAEVESAEEADAAQDDNGDAIPD